MTVEEDGAPPRPSRESLPEDAATMTTGLVRDTASLEDGEEAPEDTMPSETAWSAGERLRGRAFDRMSPSELREAEQLIDRMVLRMPMRRTRRWKLHRRGTLLAPRQMMRRNLGTGGDPIAWLWRRRVERPRGVVLLCDISGSMERHARLLLRFCHALARTDVPTEAFCFGTRLTRITPQLRYRNPDEALDRISGAVGDWSGGTRIGSAFHEFNQRWARRVLRSSSIVLVVSDGWDRGDPLEVAARDRTAPASVPSAHLAQSAGRGERLQAPGGGHGGGLAAHRCVPALARPGQPGTAGRGARR